jgi:hypothetical protein
MLCAFNWSMVGFKTCLSNVENIQILQIASLVAHTVVGVCVRAVWYIWMGMVYKSDRYVIIDICECGSQVRGELYLWCGTYVRFWCFLCQRWVITVVYFFMSKVGNICMGVTNIRDWVIGCVTQITGRSNMLVSYLR